MISDHQVLQRRLDEIIAYVRQLEARIDELERELGLRGDEESEDLEDITKAERCTKLTSEEGAE